MELFAVEKTPGVLFLSVGGGSLKHRIPLLTLVLVAVFSILPEQYILGEGWGWGVGPRGTFLTPYSAGQLVTATLHTLLPLLTPAVRMSIYVFFMTLVRKRRIDFPPL